MGFDTAKYDKAKNNVQYDLAKELKTPYDYMQEYKRCINREDYETAKAITEVLEPLKYFTADTHRHISSLN